MKSWSEHLEEVKVYEDGEIKVYQFIRVGKGCLSYMIVSEDEALIVDASRFMDDYIEAAEKRRSKNYTYSRFSFTCGPYLRR